MTTKRPIKDSVVALRCDRATKDFLKNLADARNTTVSRMILGLILDRAKLEQEQRMKPRQAIFIHEVKAHGMGIA